MHHLDSWIKRDQLDVTCFIISVFNAQYVSDVNTSILRSLRLICWVISWVVLLWFDVVWWCVIRMQAEALCATPPQANHTVTPTHIEPEQYNSLNNDIIKASDIKLVSLYSAMFSVFHVTPKRYGQYKIFIFSEIFHSYVITVVLAAVFMKFCIFWDTIYIYLLGHYIYLTTKRVL